MIVIERREKWKKKVSKALSVLRDTCTILWRVVALRGREEKGGGGTGKGMTIRCDSDPVFSPRLVPPELCTRNHYKHSRSLIKVSVEESRRRGNSVISTRAFHRKSVHATFSLFRLSLSDFIPVRTESRRGGERRKGRNEKMQQDMIPQQCTEIQHAHQCRIHRDSLHSFHAQNDRDRSSSFVQLLELRRAVLLRSSSDDESSYDA